MKEIIQKITKKGYWKVILRPVSFKEKRIPTLEDCKEIINSSKVSLRGWDYPHIGGIDKIRVAGNDSIHLTCDWKEGGHFEYWRFYQSGQFIHYFSMREDYRITKEELERLQGEFGTESTRFLSVISALYSTTEIFEFASRLAMKNIFGSCVEVIIELGNVKDRTLFFWDASRDLFTRYFCDFADEKDTIKFHKIIPKNELIVKSDKIALEAFAYILKMFNWENVKIDIFIEDQKKLLERRL